MGWVHCAAHSFREFGIFWPNFRKLRILGRKQPNDCKTESKVPPPHRSAPDNSGALLLVVTSSKPGRQVRARNADLLSDSYNNFARDAAGLHVAESVGRGLEGEDSVDCGGEETGIRPRG